MRVNIHTKSGSRRIGDHLSRKPWFAQAHNVALEWCEDAEDAESVAPKTDT